jgi:PPOX class probable F420-dependent enzyme
MRRTTDDLTAEMLAFLAERHLATLTTTRADGTAHVVPVGFGYDHGSRTVRIITFAGSMKAANAARIGPDDTPGRAVVSQVDGGRWLTLEGPVRLVTDPAGIAAAIAAYAARYRQPADKPDRVAIEIAVDRIMGRA